MLLFGAVIGRRVYTVFGALGIAGYLGHLSYKVFKDSLVFPVALMLIGLGILGVTVGSARLAKRRHLDAPATDHRQSGP